MAGSFGVHPTRIHACNKQLLGGAEAVFANGTTVDTTDHEARQAELFEQIGRLKMELQWLKKSSRLRLRPSDPWSRLATPS
ncbi:MAG TPA: hypothetical protein VMF69_11000 [Gemmataceae bacterium]|nr:hypothetical protein [Gemmataceae bacterium]